MTEALKEYVKRWLAKADEDIHVLNDLLKSEPEYYTGSICFHAQQAAEKYLKAFLVYHSIDFPRTHDLDFLLSLCIKIESSLESINLMDLSEFGVAIRYPDDFLVPTISDAQFYSRLASEIGTIIKSKIVL